LVCRFSPDEIALVKFTESVGLALSERDFTSISLKNPLGEMEHFDVLHIFPFTSASYVLNVVPRRQQIADLLPIACLRKRMGIIVKDRSSEIITFYVKGADTVMSKMVKFNDWVHNYDVVIWHSLREHPDVVLLYSSMRNGKLMLF
jgi:phospholipid-translocating ATPase